VELFDGFAQVFHRQQMLVATIPALSVATAGTVVMESFFSTVKSELGDQFASHGDAKMELFDYIEVFYNQRGRHSTLGRISPAAFERRAATQAT
jgi:hypothetical protein